MMLYYTLTKRTYAFPRGERYIKKHKVFIPSSIRENHKEVKKYKYFNEYESNTEVKIII